MQRVALSVSAFARRTGPILAGRIGPILVAAIRALVGIPMMLLRGIGLVVQRVVSLIVDTVTLALRAAFVVLVVGSVVIGLSYVPAVRAALPFTREVTARADPWLQQAEDLRGRLLTQLQRVGPLQHLSQRPSGARPSGRVRPAATPKTAAAPRRTSSIVSVAVRSTPPGATVLLDHRRAGKAPVTLRVKPGTYRLTVSHPGYLSETRTVIVKAGQPISLEVNLSRPP